jgi:peptidoglycan/xylan/chitin deacetylase (PgdA/CDA1 family)
MITLDVHQHPNLNRVVLESAELFAKHGDGVTYFVPSVLVAQHKDLRQTLRRVQELGHSIGCHGLTHDASEDLGSLSRARQWTLLKDATSILSDALGAPVSSFRAPGFRLGDLTLSLLAELGYRADLSVTPQRLSVMSSSPFTLGWLWAPRRVYRPNATSPFRRGDVELLEIPTSSLILPLSHGTVANLPDSVSVALLKILIVEAKYLHRVIVPMFHPEAVVGEAEPWCPTFRWRDLIPRRYGGMHCRFYFFLERDQATIHRRTMTVLRHLREEEGLQSLSVDEYLLTMTPDRAQVEPGFA